MILDPSLTPIQRCKLIRWKSEILKHPNPWVKCNGSDMHSCISFLLISGMWGVIHVSESNNCCLRCIPSWYRQRLPILGKIGRLLSHSKLVQNYLDCLGNVRKNSYKQAHNLSALGHCELPFCFKSQECIQFKWIKYPFSFWALWLSFIYVGIIKQI